MCGIDAAIVLFTLVSVIISSCYSLTIEQVGPVLSLAAATSNIDMRDACIAKLSVDTDRILSIPAILENISEEQLKCLLTKPEMSTLGAEFRLRVVCRWVDGGKVNSQLQERLDRFKQLLELVDLASITERTLLDFIRSDYAVTESKPHQ